MAIATWSGNTLGESATLLPIIGTMLIDPVPGQHQVGGPMRDLVIGQRHRPQAGGTERLTVARPPCPAGRASSTPMRATFMFPVRPRGAADDGAPPDAAGVDARRPVRPRCSTCQHVVGAGVAEHAARGLLTAVGGGDDVGVLQCTRLVSW